MTPHAVEQFERIRRSGARVLARKGKARGRRGCRALWLHYRRPWILPAGGSTRRRGRLRRAGLEIGAQVRRASCPSRTGRARSGRAGRRPASWSGCRRPGCARAYTASSSTTSCGSTPHARAAGPALRAAAAQARRRPGRSGPGRPDAEARLAGARLRPPPHPNRSGRSRSRARGRGWSSTRSTPPRRWRARSAWRAKMSGATVLYLHTHGPR